MVHRLLLDVSIRDEVTSSAPLLDPHAELLLDTWDRIGREVEFIIRDAADSAMPHCGVPRRGIRGNPEYFIIEDHDQHVPTEEVRVPTVRVDEDRAKRLDLMIQILGRDAHKQERPLSTRLEATTGGVFAGSRKLSLTTMPR
jgi:hypothetical protein